jgi:hypothetical protein
MLSAKEVTEVTSGAVTRIRMESGVLETHFLCNECVNMLANKSKSDFDDGNLETSVQQWASTAAEHGATGTRRTTSEDVLVRVEKLIAAGHILPEEAELIMMGCSGSPQQMRDVGAGHDGAPRRPQVFTRQHTLKELMAVGKAAQARAEHKVEVRVEDDFSEAAEDTWADDAQHAIVHEAPTAVGSWAELARRAKQRVPEGRAKEEDMCGSDLEQPQASARVRHELMQLLLKGVYKQTTRGERGGGSVVRARKLVGGAHGVTQEQTAALIPIVLKAVQAEVELQQQSMTESAELKTAVTQRELHQADMDKCYAEQRTEELLEMAKDLSVQLEQSHQKLLLAEANVGTTCSAMELARTGNEKHKAKLVLAMKELARIAQDEQKVLEEGDELEWCIRTANSGVGPVRQEGMSVAEVVAMRAARSKDVDVEKLQLQLKAEREKLKGFPAQRREVHYKFYQLERAAPGTAWSGRSKLKALEDVTSSDYGTPRVKALLGGASLTVAREVEQWLRRLCTGQQDALSLVVPLIMFLVECTEGVDCELMMNFCEERLPAGVAKVNSEWLLDAAECDGMRETIDRQLALVYLHLDKIMHEVVMATHHPVVLGGDTRAEFTVHAPKEGRSGWLVLQWILGSLRQVTRQQVRIYNDMYRDCYAMLSTMGITAGIAEIEKHLDSAKELGAVANYPDTIQKMYNELTNKHTRYTVALYKWETYDAELCNFDNVLVHGLTDFLKAAKHVNGKLDASITGKASASASAVVKEAAKDYLASAAKVDVEGVTARAAAVNFSTPSGKKEGKAAAVDTKRVYTDSTTKCKNCKNFVSTNILKVAKDNGWKVTPDTCYTCYRKKKETKDAKAAAVTPGKETWVCSSVKCSFKNYMDRQLCYKCKTARPGTAEAKVASSGVEEKLEALTKKFEQATAMLAKNNTGWKDD